MNPFLLLPYPYGKKGLRAPMMPAFMPTQINFYDPLTGRQGPTINSADNVMSTSRFVMGDIDVNLSGKKSDVDRAEQLLKMNAIVQPTITTGSDAIKYYNINQVIPSLALVQPPIVPKLPSFMSAKINFANPIMGQSPGDVIVTSKFADCGIAIDITGKKSDTDRIESLLRINYNSEMSGTTHQSPVTQNTFSTGSMSPTVVPTPVLHGKIIPTELPEKYRNGFTNPPRVEVKDWTYVANSSNREKVLLAHPSLNKPFSGSGVIFLERKGPKGPAIILARTKRGTFEDFGGEIDSRTALDKDTIKNNARKEAFEESQGLFAIMNLDLDRKVSNQQLYVDITDATNNAVYRCYFVALQDTESFKFEDWFMSNKSLLESKTLGRDYAETIELKRFSLRDIFACAAASAQHSAFSCVDTNGVVGTIRDRTANCIKAMMLNHKLVRQIFANPVSVVYNQENNVYSPMHRMIKLTL